LGQRGCKNLWFDFIPRFELLNSRIPPEDAPEKGTARSQQEDGATDSPDLDALSSAAQSKAIVALGHLRGDEPQAGPEHQPSEPARSA